MGSAEGVRTDCALPPGRLTVVRMDCSACLLEQGMTLVKTMARAARRLERVVQWRAIRQRQGLGAKTMTHLMRGIRWATVVSGLLLGAQGCGGDDPLRSSGQAMVKSSAIDARPGAAGGGHGEGACPCKSGGACTCKDGCACKGGDAACACKSGGACTCKDGCACKSGDGACTCKSGGACACKDGCACKSDDGACTCKSGGACTCKDGCACKSGSSCGSKRGCGCQRKGEHDEASGAFQKSGSCGCKRGHEKGHAKGHAKGSDEKGMKSCPHALRSAAPLG